MKNISEEKPGKSPFTSALGRTPKEKLNTEVKHLYNES